MVLKLTLNQVLDKNLHPWESDDDLCIYEQDSKTIEHVLSLLAQQIPIQIEVLIGNVVRYRVSRTDDEAGQEWGIDMYERKLVEQQRIVMDMLATQRLLEQRSLTAREKQERAEDGT